MTTALIEKLGAPREETLEQLERIVVLPDRIKITLKHDREKFASIEIPWMEARQEAHIRPTQSRVHDNQKLLKSVVRARVWLNDLSTSRYSSIEDLAAAVDVHPKVIRQELQLAFLAPKLTRTALDGDANVALKLIPKLLPLCWYEQRHRVLG